MNLQQRGDEEEKMSKKKNEESEHQIYICRKEFVCDRVDGKKGERVNDRVQRFIQLFNHFFPFHILNVRANEGTIFVAKSFRSLP